MDVSMYVAALVGAGIDPAWDEIALILGAVVLLVAAPLAVAWRAGWVGGPLDGRRVERSGGNGGRDQVERRRLNWPI